MAPQNSPPSSLQTYVKRLWIHGFLAGFGLVLIILFVGFYIWGWPTSPNGEVEPAPTISQAPATPARPPAPAVQATVPPTAPVQTPAAVKEELAGVLAKLAEAHQRKDLPQLLSLYAPTFPDLHHKAQEIARTWATYDYPSLRFRIEEIKSQDPENVFARVVWEAETRSRATQRIGNLTKTYLVWFTNDAGRWRIKGLDKTQ